MRNNVLLVLSAVFLSMHAVAQQGDGGYKIHYEMTFRKDRANAERTSEMTELLVSGEKSLFRTVLQAEKDTADYHKELMKQPYVSAYTNARYRILKDPAKQITHYYEQVQILDGPICTYSESQDSMAWKLTNDTLMINNFLCQKALLTYGNRSWEAWFCPDIPISDGPYKFRGLPGLIVRIHDSTDSWLFNLAKIERVPPFTFDLAFLEDVEVLEKMAFYKQKAHYRDNRLQINETAGKISFPDEKTRQSLYKKAKEHAAKDNNWIELYP